MNEKIWRRPYVREARAATDQLGRPVNYQVYQPNLRIIEPDPREAIVLANGWTAGAQVMGRAAAWFAAQGRSVIVFDHQRTASSEEHPEKHKMMTLAATVEAYCQEAQEDQVEIIGHSEGGINSTMYAVYDRESESNRVKSLTLFAPAGIIDLSVAQLVYRGTREIVSLANRRQAKNLGRLAYEGASVSGYLRKNIGLSVREVAAISHADIMPDLEALHQNGLPLGVIGCTDDRFFPAHELSATIEGHIPYSEIASNHVDFINDRLVRAQVYGLHQRFSSELPLGDRNLIPTTAVQ